MDGLFLFFAAHQLIFLDSQFHVLLQINTACSPVCGLVTRSLTRGHDCLGEARPRHRSDGVAVDVVFASLDGQSVWQAQHPQLGSAVVGLAEITIDACGRSRHDDSGHRRAEATSQWQAVPCCSTRHTHTVSLSGTCSSCMHRHSRMHI